MNIGDTITLIITILCTIFIIIDIVFNIQSMKYLNDKDQDKLKLILLSDFLIIIPNINKILYIASIIIFYSIYSVIMTYVFSDRCKKSFVSKLYPVSFSMCFCILFTIRMM